VALDGKPINIRVIQGIGLGLDECAIDAVKRWRFQPALAGDVPVVAPATIEVGFHLI
jgi:protein TonB